MWTSVAKLRQKTPQIGSYSTESIVRLGQTWLWGYVGKTWIECECRRMSPINRLTTTKDSKNLVYLGKNGKEDVADKPSTKSLIRALEGGTNRIPPIWLMRQAGRYLPEYRAIREK